MANSKFVTGSATFSLVYKLLFPGLGWVLVYCRKQNNDIIEKLPSSNFHKIDPRHKKGLCLSAKCSVPNSPLTRWPIFYGYFLLFFATIIAYLT